MITFVDTLLSANKPIQYLEQSSITAKQYLPSIFWSEVSICHNEFGCFLCQRIYFILFFLFGFGLVRLCLLRILFIVVCPTSTKFSIFSAPQPVLFLIEIIVSSIFMVVL